MELGVGADRDLAAPFQTPQEGSLSGHGHCCRGIVESLTGCGVRGSIVRADRHCQRALPRRRQHKLRIQPFADAMSQLKSKQAGRGKDDGGPLGMSIELCNAGFDIASQVYDPEIRPGLEELGPSSKTAGTDRCASWQLIPADSTATYQRIAGILSLTHGAKADTIWEFGRQVLQGVHCEIDSALQQGIIYLLREKRPAADLGEG